MRRNSARWPAVTVAFLSMVPPAWAADYEPPADGKLTDRQVAAYIAIMREQRDATRAGAKAVDAAPSEAARIAIAADMSHKVEAANDHHGLPPTELEWVEQQVDAAAPGAIAQQAWEAAKPGLDREVADAKEAVKAAEARHDAAAADAAKQQLATVQSVVTAGPAGLDPDAKANPDNVALVRKHLKDYYAALGVPDPAPAATTAPATTAPVAR